MPILALYEKHSPAYTAKNTVEVADTFEASREAFAGTALAAQNCMVLCAAHILLAG
jgi:hypothetical protein